MLGVLPFLLLEFLSIERYRLQLSMELEILRFLFGLGCSKKQNKKRCCSCCERIVSSFRLPSLKGGRSQKTCSKRVNMFSSLFVELRTIKCQIRSHLLGPKKGRAVPKTAALPNPYHFTI
jgi:hypothetical protein